MRKIFINGIGLILTTFILCSMVMLKFNEGGWATLLITGLLIGMSLIIKTHYQNTLKMLSRLNVLLQTASAKSDVPAVPFDPRSKTAAVLVNGFNGLGLHTALAIIKNFGKDFKNFVFIQVGVIDAGNFKGIEEVGHLRASVQEDLDRYVNFMNSHGYYAEGRSSLGTEVVEEVEHLADGVAQQYADGLIFFGGQLVFPQDTVMTRWLHNYTVFSIQKRFYRKGIPFMILHIQV